MKIVVTGATGFVGRRLVALLAEGGAELLLVGREPRRIERLFPSWPACGYEELAERAAGFDLIVHLAVANNDAALSEAQMRAVNVDLMLRTAESARRAGVPRFVNVSSVHALDPDLRTAYAKTKREAVERLAEVEGIETVNVFLPPVYAGRWSGKLAFLNALPPSLAGAVAHALSAIKPTVRVEDLAAFLLDGAAAGADGDVILSGGQGDNLVYRGVKRTIDLVFALAVAVLFWWALVVIWALVRFESPGPGIFAQPRVGRDGRVFTCFKFRTMKRGTMQAATNLVSADAVTGVGGFLRATKLDELPQIWNILRNEVSLIGPRPCLPVQSELIDARRRRQVLRLKPGISGLAQVNGIDMSDPERLARWDARYLALQSLLLDLRIILATATGRGQGDRVAREG